MIIPEIFGVWLTVQTPGMEDNDVQIRRGRRFINSLSVIWRERDEIKIYFLKHQQNIIQNINKYKHIKSNCIRFWKYIDIYNMRNLQYILYNYEERNSFFFGHVLSIFISKLNKLDQNIPLHTRVFRIVPNWQVY